MQKSTELIAVLHHDGVAARHDVVRTPAMGKPISKTREAERLRKQLRAFMARRSLKAFPWSKAAGVAQSALPNFLRGDSDTLELATLKKLADAAQVPITEMLGEAMIRTRGDAARIRVLEITAGPSGSYSVVEEPDEPPFLFPKPWADRTFGANSANLRVAIFDGDSMAPTIKDGDICVVRLQAPRDKIHQGRIYLLWDGNGLIVKRVEVVVATPSRYRLSSDNRAISQPYEIDGMGERIVGQVIWRGGSL